MSRSVDTQKTLTETWILCVSAHSFVHFVLSKESVDMTCRGSGNGSGIYLGNTSKTWILIVIWI